MADKKQKKGGGTRKYERNRTWCKTYALNGQREKNKAIRLRKHLALHASDTQSQLVFDALPTIAKKYRKQKGQGNDDQVLLHTE